MIEETGPYVADPLEVSQNESPTVGTLLALADKWPGSTMDGYIIRKPRADYRVSVDAIDLRTPWLALGWVQDVVGISASADTCEVTEDARGVVAHLWWD
jgi:hypothetical protein